MIIANFESNSKSSILMEDFQSLYSLVLKCVPWADKDMIFQYSAGQTSSHLNKNKKTSDSVLQRFSHET